MIEAEIDVTHPISWTDVAPHRERLLKQLRETAATPLREARSLPPAFYTDPQVFELEKAAVFAREWLCVGRAADMPDAGDYLVLELQGLASVMAVRQKDGSILGLSRVCRHRAALLGADEGGSAKLFTCPYHKWVYELDGALRGAPGSETVEGFSNAACALPRYPIEIWEGFVFISLDANAAPLGPQLAAISERLAAYGMASMKSAALIAEDWPTNWKVAFENGCESYHHIGVHQQSLNPMYPGLGTRCDAGTDTYNFHVVPYADGAGAGGEGGLVIVGIYPNLALALAEGSLTWFAFEPAGHDKTHVRVGMAFTDDGSGAPVSAERAEQFRGVIQAIVDEDRVSCSGVQRGLATLDAASGPLMPIEQTIAEFIRYLDGRLNG